VRMGFLAENEWEDGRREAMFRTRSCGNGAPHLVG
jgi:hypothetical protein